MLDVILSSFKIALDYISKPILWREGISFSILTCLVGFALIGLLIWFVRGLLK